MRKVGLAILGYGTVGQGVAKIIQDKMDLISFYSNCELEIKRVLEIDFDRPRQVELPREIFTDNIDDIISDDSIEIVVEVTSALDPAKDMIVRALESGKSVVSANKAAISRYYEDLSSLAKEKNVHFLYEASVAGGIPILKPLTDIVMHNEIDRVRGILNGTGNYILSKMTEEGLDYSEVLKEAQALGYAEADPSSDVNGTDTLRKLRILSTIAFRQRVGEEDILLEGISKITAEDIINLDEMHRTIKLIGDAWVEDGEVKAVVQPVAVYSDSYFASVTDAYNSVTVHGDVVGELKFYGSGAGMLPTGDAIMRDILDIVMTRQSKSQYGVGQNRPVKSSDIRGDFYIRYNPSKADLSSYGGEEISQDPRIVVVEDINLKEAMDKLKADEDALIIRLEGEDY